MARPMCCAGCAAVAQTIVDNGLASYYRERQSFPDRENAVPQALRDLTVYDVQEKAAGEPQPADSHLRETALIIEGIRCAACVWGNCSSWWWACCSTCASAVPWP